MEGLNNIKLNGEMLASLYSRSIVDLADHQPAAIKLKKTLILFRGSTRDNLPDNQQRFLDQILKACELDTRDIHIVNLASDKVVLENIISSISPGYILSFGTGSGTELFTMENRKGTKYLNAPDLSEMMKETESSKKMKGKLWSELKAMFNLK